MMEMRSRTEELYIEINLYLNKDMVNNYYVGAACEAKFSVSQHV